jgi:hypothetical protein
LLSQPPRVQHAAKDSCPCELRAFIVLPLGCGLYRPPRKPASVGANMLPVEFDGVARDDMLLVPTHGNRRCRHLGLAEPEPRRAIRRVYAAPHAVSGSYVGCISMACS